ncbi:MAG TPA: hypothetical protein VFW21_03100 [Mycobacterium sp.]|nr:hypothetical protein [Mycobacterium sp.]
MIRLRPGWLVALCATLLAVSVWLPWLTTRAAGGGHASGIGGTVGSLELPPRFGAGQAITLLTSLLLVAGAMTGREIAQRWASAGALVLSLCIVGLIAWYHHLNVGHDVAAGYGWYVGAVLAGIAVLVSLWAVIDAARPRGGRR